MDQGSGQLYKSLRGSGRLREIVLMLVWKFLLLHYTISRLRILCDTTLLKHAINKYCVLLVERRPASLASVSCVRLCTPVLVVYTHTHTHV